MAELFCNNLGLQCSLESKIKPENCSVTQMTFRSKWRTRKIADNSVEITDINYNYRTCKICALSESISCRDAPETLQAETETEMLGYETETRPRRSQISSRRDRDRDPYHPRRDRNETLSTCRSRDSRETETSRSRSSPWYKR